MSVGQRAIVYPSGRSAAAIERQSQENEDWRQDLAATILRVRRKLGSGHPAYQKACRQAIADLRRRRRRERKRQMRYLDDMHLTPQAPDFVDQLLDLEQVGVLIGARPEKEREALVAMFLLGLDRGETAAKMGVSKQAVTRIRDRAIKAIRRSARP